MSKRRPAVAIAGLLFTALLLPWPAEAQEDRENGTPGILELSAALETQNKELSRELVQIKREIAALRQDMEKPGAQEVLSGIGYILGLFGIGAYVASRRKEGR